MRAGLALLCVLFGACVLNTKVSCNSMEFDGMMADDSATLFDDVITERDAIAYDEPSHSDQAFWDDQPQKSFDQLFQEIAMSNNASMDFVQADGSLLLEYDIKYKREVYDEMVNNGGIEATYGLKQSPSYDTGNRRVKRKAIKTNRWTNKRVPYVISNVFTSADRSAISSAFNDYHRYTCIRFSPATNSDRNKIVLQNGGGCSSYVGMIGGQQSVSLGRGCRMKGIIIHELGHAIGFNHEQTRPDRDNYVTIYTQNIVNGMAYNFNKYTTSTINSMGVPYDYTSVMHYGGTAFSKNGQYTIVAKDRSYQSRMGSRYGFSFRDIKLANLVYSCNSHCPRKNCPGEGFVGKDCNCWCPGTSSSPITQCSGGPVRTTTRRPVVTTTRPTNGCDRDIASRCDTYKSRGYCCKTDRFYNYMSQNCKKTCNICNNGAGSCTTTSSCVDKKEHCNYWKGRNYCSSTSTYASFMRTNCPKTCGHCAGGGTTTTSSCTNKSTTCPSWRRAGYCTHSYYQSYMRQNCAKECGVCR